MTRQIIIITNPTESDIDRVFGLNLPITTVQTRSAANESVDHVEYAQQIDRADRSNNIRIKIDPQVVETLTSTQSELTVINDDTDDNTLVDLSNYNPDDIDVDGERWDENKHSSSRQKNADGRWKARRGTGLKAQVAAGNVAILPNVPTIPIPPTNPTLSPFTPPVPPARVEQVFSPDQPLTLPQAAKKLIADILESIARGELTEDGATHFAKEVGLETYSGLLLRPQLHEQLRGKIWPQPV